MDRLEMPDEAVNQLPREIFESLHKEYQPMVLQMCLGFMKGDYPQAQDLAQEVFINTWNAINKFRGASTYKTWIYRITINTCLKFIRDSKDINRVDLSDLNNIPDVTSNENSTEIEIIHQHLYQAIGKLKKVDRLIIMMVLEELSYNEIANIMGVNAVNLRVKIHRIKVKLRELIDDE